MVWPASCTPWGSQDSRHLEALGLPRQHRERRSLGSLLDQQQASWQWLILTHEQTANVIANMKSLKISGLALPIQSIIQDLRLEELRVGGRFRMVLTYSVVIAFAPFFISPVVVGPSLFVHRDRLATNLVTWRETLDDFR